jgi:hypothetical protein
MGMGGRKWLEEGEDASPNIIKVIKQSTMRWAEHVALMGEMRNA